MRKKCDVLSSSNSCITHKKKGKTKGDVMIINLHYDETKPRFFRYNKRYNKANRPVKRKRWRTETAEEGKEGDGENTVVSVTRLLY
jgi:hypothetical protein